MHWGISIDKNGNWLFIKDESLMEQKDNVAVKHDQGKPSISHIPPETLLGVMEVFGFGGKKYGKYNFRNPMDHTRALDALFRHGFSILKGEDIDPESGMPHIYHLICSAIIYDWQRLNHPDRDDRYKKPANDDRSAE